LVLTLLNFMDSSKREDESYNYDQNEAQTKD
jgi:hypothetical protein